MKRLGLTGLAVMLVVGASAFALGIAPLSHAPSAEAAHSVDCSFTLDPDGVGVELASVQCTVSWSGPHGDRCKLFTLLWNDVNQDGRINWSELHSIQLVAEACPS